MNEERFHVCIFNSDGFWHYVRTNLSAEKSVDRALRLVRQAENGEWGIDRVMIEDADGDTTFLWQRGKGVVFPKWDAAPDAG